MGFSGRFGPGLLLALGESLAERGFGGVHPPAVDAGVEEPRAEVAPEDVARRGVVGVEDLVSGPRPFVEQRSGSLQIAVHGRFGAESRPHRHQQPHAVLLVQAGDGGPGVRVAHGVPLEGVPPGFFAPVLPVLHDDVDRDVPAAVFADHAGQFVETLVAFARLPEPESPFRKHRRRAGQRTVAAHASCGIAPVDEPVIDGVAHLRREFESVASVAELRGRVVVPQQSEAARGDQIGVDDVLVGLQQQDRVAFVVQGARLVLAQSVQRLVVGPGEPLGHGVARLAAHGVGTERAGGFREQQGVRAGVAEREEAPRAVELHPELRRAERIAVFDGLAAHLDGSRGHGIHDQPLRHEGRSGRADEDAHGVFRAELDAVGHARLVEREGVAVARGTAAGGADGGQQQGGEQAHHRLRV